MAALDWSQCPAVESVPGKVSGAWVFRGTRMPVATVFAGLEEGMTINDLIETYDGLTREHIEAVLEFAARSLETPASAREMRILFDQGAPVQTRRSLEAHRRQESKGGAPWPTVSYRVSRKRPGLTCCSQTPKTCVISKTSKVAGLQSSSLATACGRS